MPSTANMYITIRMKLLMYSMMGETRAISRQTSLPLRVIHHTRSVSRQLAASDVDSGATSHTARSSRRKAGYTVATSRRL